MPRPLLAALLLVVLAPAARADAQKPTFDADVAAILKQHCATCHSNEKQRGGLNLATFAVTMEGGSSGEVVVAGDADKSRLYTLTAHKEEPVMPPSKQKIPEVQIATLKLWIEQGARENAGSKAAVVKPKVDIGLKSVARGRPAGPPPMPVATQVKLDPLPQSRRAGAVLALASSPWAPVIAVGGQKQVLLHHADTGDLLAVLPFDGGQINSVKFSRNAKLILVAGGRGGASGKAVLYNVETGAKVTEVGSAETDAILAADLSPDQTLIAVGTTTRLVRIYNVADGSVAQTVKKHTDWVTAVEFAPDGVLLATGDRNGGVFVWEAATAREFHSLRGHTGMITDLSWRADSNLLATASLDGGVRLWEMENGGQVKTWAAHPGGAESVRFAADGRIATTGRDKLTKLWDGNGGLQKSFEAHGDIGLRVAVSHDNAKIISGDWSGKLKAFAAADAKVAYALDTNPPTRAEAQKLAEQAIPAAEAKAKQAADALAAVTLKAKQAAEAHAAAQAVAGKRTGDLAAAQKVAAERTAAVPALTAQLAPLKAEADRLTAAIAAASNKAAAAEVVVAVQVEAVQKLQAAAAKPPANPDLAPAVQAAQALLTQQQAAVVVAKKAQQDAAAAQQAAAAKRDGVQKQLADAQAQLAEAQKQVAALPAQVKAAQDALPAAKAAQEVADKAVAPAKAAADAAAAELAAAQAKLQRLKAATPVAAR